MTLISLVRWLIGYAQYVPASGAPGPAYYQQQADYKIDIELDDKKAKLSGSETITYYNNSPDSLEYLWIQLIKIKQRKIPIPLAESEKWTRPFQLLLFSNKFAKGLDRGFNLEYVKDANGNAMSYTVNHTMMRIYPYMKPNSTISFSIKWWYNINDYQKMEAVPVTNSLKRRKQIVCNCPVLS
jgi:hypothetical protein